MRYNQRKENIIIIGRVCYGYCENDNNGCEKGRFNSKKDHGDSGKEGCGTREENNGRRREEDDFRQDDNRREEAGDHSKEDDGRRKEDDDRCKEDNNHGEKACGSGNRQHQREGDRGREEAD